MKSKLTPTFSKGFSLVEILVVVAILTLLASVLTVGALEAGQKSRDAKRQADLTLLQNAVELFCSRFH